MGCRPERQASVLLSAGQDADAVYAELLRCLLRRLCRTQAGVYGDLRRSDSRTFWIRHFADSTRLAVSIMSSILTELNR